MFPILALATAGSRLCGSRGPAPCRADSTRTAPSDCVLRSNRNERRPAAAQGSCANGQAGGRCGLLGPARAAHGGGGAQVDRAGRAQCAATGDNATPPSSRQADGRARWAGPLAVAPAGAAGLLTCGPRHSAGRPAGERGRGPADARCCAPNVAAVSREARERENVQICDQTGAATRARAHATGGCQNESPNRVQSAGRRGLQVATFMLSARVPVLTLSVRPPVAGPARREQQAARVCSSSAAAAPGRGLGRLNGPAAALAHSAAGRQAEPRAFPQSNRGARARCAGRQRSATRLADAGRRWPRAEFRPVRPRTRPATTAPAAATTTTITELTNRAQLPRRGPADFPTSARGAAAAKRDAQRPPQRSICPLVFMVIN
jgi:hypothetical protein